MPFYWTYTEPGKHRHRELFCQVVNIEYIKIIYNYSKCKVLEVYICSVRGYTNAV